MENKIDLSIVIPVYNEQGSLKTLVAQLSEVDLPYTMEVIFIDDGSDDGSTKILKELQTSSDLNIHCYILRRNFGKSAAMAVGMEKAQGAIIATLDADLQNDPKDLPQVLQTIEQGADLVVGWRIHREDPLEKTFMSKLFNWATSKFSGLQLHDFNCGLKVYRREVLKGIALYGDMHRFIPVLAHKQGFVVKEVTITHHPRRHDVSKFGIERYFRGSMDLLTVLFLTTYLVRPMHLFGGIGISTIVLGTLMFLYLVLGRWIWGIAIGASPLLAVSLLAIGIGVQIVIFGLLAEMLVHFQKSRNQEGWVKHVWK